MQALSKTPPDAPCVLTVACPRHAYEKVLHFLAQAGCLVDEGISPAVVFPDRTPGTVLRGLRHRDNLTQAALAARAGVPRNHISEMETGKRRIGRRAARRLAQALNTDPRMFLWA